MGGDGFGGGFGGGEGVIHQTRSVFVHFEQHVLCSIACDCLSCSNFLFLTCCMNNRFDNVALSFMGTPATGKGGICCNAKEERNKKKLMKVGQ